MTVSFTPLSDVNIVRAEQLSQKTNQFNTTTRRHRRGDLQALAESGDAEVTVIGLADRFTDREYVGLAVVCDNKRDLPAAEIESFILSCRVLGRGVEQGVLAWIVERARLRGMKHVLGTIVVTPRNGPCREIYSQAGFDFDDEERRWRLDLARADISYPQWLSIDSRSNVLVAEPSVRVKK
jgi:FkbH-like protein